MNKMQHVERRSDARIVRSALDEVKAIQTLLADVYKDVGDGRTLLRELVQNADDAGAERLVFAVVEHGWSEAQNSLLQGPALIVANNGPFPAQDHDALHQALGGSKADDAGKVGRFGIGLKSVFHICEAIVYLGAEEGVLRPGALNPWAGTGAIGDADPLHPDWDGVGEDDLNRLLGVANNLLGKFENGLVQWIPLRRTTHLDRAKDKQYGIGHVCPNTDDVVEWFGRPTSLALLLAQSGHLVSIEAYTAQKPHNLNSCDKLAYVVRPHFKCSEWIGRYKNDNEVPDRAFEGLVEDGSRSWSIKGVEALGSNSLRRLRNGKDWPTDPHWRNGTCVWVSRKALAHAAITVLHPHDNQDGFSGVRLRWAVFLPLDDDPSPRPSPVVETVGCDQDSSAWDIILHGYFWPSHDRRSIPGVTEEDYGTSNGDVRVRWNRAVCNELLLPLLPSTVSAAISDVPEGTSRSLLKSISKSKIVSGHLASVTRRHLLLPIVFPGGVFWEARLADGISILSIPKWREAPDDIRDHFFKRFDKSTKGIVFIDRDSPRLGGDVGTWPHELIEKLLNCITRTAFRNPQGLHWIGVLLRHLIGSSGDTEDSRTVLVANWLAFRISEGALGPAVKGTSAEEQKELRSKWLYVFTALPQAWLVSAPLATQRAVADLSKDGVVGAGLLPIPLGHSNEIDSFSRPDIQRLDAALLKLGKWLLKESEASQRTRRSRLLLAEALLPYRGDKPPGEDLRCLPLLRARSLPDDKDHAWSIVDLQCKSEQRLVFSRPSADSNEDGSAFDTPPDPKKAVTELSKALGEAVWIVDGAVASIASVPLPSLDALAHTVLSCEMIRSSPDERIGLLQRLAMTEDTGELTVRNAIVKLLTGQKAVSDAAQELYYVRSEDSDRIANQESLRILLHLLERNWCAIDASLVEPLPHAIVDSLSVKAVDFGVLHKLLMEILDTFADWSLLERCEAIHLLHHLYSIEPEDHGRWRKMPLHRRLGGGRGSFDESARKAFCGLKLPRELESEIRPLEPDLEVANLYQDVPTLDGDGILRVMLVSQRPHQFAKQIVCSLRHGNDTHVILPRDTALLKLLESSEWLPLQCGESGVAPEKLLVLPNSDLQKAVGSLAIKGAFGDHRLVSDIDISIWRNAKDVVHDILKRPSPLRQVRRLATAVESSRVIEVDNGAYALFPKASELNAPLISDILQSALVDSNPGWSLVRTAVNAVRPESNNALDNAPASAQDVIVSFARSFCGNVPATRQAEALRTLATTRPAKESPTGRVFRKFVEAFASTPEFFNQVLPLIELPTQDGQWHLTRKIARSTSGIARRHRLLSDFREPLHLNSDEPVHGEIESDFEIGLGTADTLARYFESWIDRLPGGAVGAFLGLLGNGKDEAILDLSQRWLGGDVSVEGMRRTLSKEVDGDPCGSVRVFVSGRIASGLRVEALNLLGDLVPMEAGSEDDMIFAADPVRRSSALGGFWEITLRAVAPETRTGHDLISLLGNSAEWWAVHVLRIKRHAVRSWWARWGTGSQAQVGPVQASILAHLPLTLHQLDVRECQALNAALQNAQRAQRRREQAPAALLNEAIKIERSALSNLASLIQDVPEHQRFIWNRVQDMMQRYGYREDSVLLELAQNADDALSQASEIAGQELPREVRRLIVRVSQNDNVPTVDIIHYGRPINDTGGSAFPVGRDRQWDQDLYFMMLLNLSGKPGEAPGQSSVASTTGRFGLGFKSVHLVSEVPSVVSGFVAFSIAGGLLPLEKTVPNDPDLQPIQGHRATRVRLPIRTDVRVPNLIDKMFLRFDYARILLPAFAREIREVLVDGGSHAGISSFDGEPIDGAPGWSVAKGNVGFPGNGQWRLLRFRPADVIKKSGTEALIIGLREGTPNRFPSDLPFLWNVTPTSEGWGCGYAINGPFKLDPGRTHVSLDDTGTLRVADLLGEALGQGLIDLYDVLMAGKSAVPSNLPTVANAGKFLASLWKVLATGIDTVDDLRKTLLLRLQGPGRGLSVWMRARAAVPSGLPKPFSVCLPSINNEGFEVAADGLDTPDICRAFALVDEIAALACQHRVVTSEVAHNLKILLKKNPQKLRPSDLFRDLLETWNHKLTADRLHSLRPIRNDDVWQKIGDNPQIRSNRLFAYSVRGELVSIRRLLIPRALTVNIDDSIVEEELRRSAFAPDDVLLNHGYIDSDDDLTMFLRLRVRHEIDSEIIASWFADLPTDRRPAALRYLLDGRLQNEVLERLVSSENRPDWLNEYDAVRLILEDLGEEHWRLRSLLAALFPDRFEDLTEPTTLDQTLPESKKRNFFERFEEWWNDPNVRRDVIESYEKKAWPDWLRREGLADGLRKNSTDHWLGLLVLGACRSLGRSKAAQHRNFLELTRKEGWWDVFKNPEDTAAWMDTLRSWQDKAIASLTYPRWMSLFPSIYQLSRYLGKYRRLLLSAGRRPAGLYQVSCLLAPRIDEALTGAGYHFDAPPAPLNMGLHWVMRELVRLGLIDGHHLYPDCWVPSEQVLLFLRRLGLEIPNGNISNSEKAKRVFKFLASELGTATPNLYRAFDIPLRHVDDSSGTQQQLGMEDY